MYPSALHVRWRRPDGEVIGALAVDDEPEVFWDGAGAAERIGAWRAAVGWRGQWGSVGLAGGNGSSGRVVVEDVLQPLGVEAGHAYFTDCLPYYFVKPGKGSQKQRIDEVYQPFAAEHGLPTADLPLRPAPTDLVHRAVMEESDDLRRQFAEAGAPRIVTLGQEAADVVAALAGTERMKLRPDATYGTPCSITVGGTRLDWVPLTHPGNRTPAWRARHRAWASGAPYS